MIPVTARKRNLCCITAVRLKPVKVVIDGEIYESYPGHGIARIFSEVVPRMAKLGVRSQVVVRGGVSQERIGQAVLPYIRWIPQIRPRFRPWRLWVPLSMVMNRLIGRLYWRMRADDVFISTCYTQRPVTAKRICFVYDMIHELFPPAGENRGYHETIRRKRESILGAHAIICISEQTKRDVIRIVGVKESQCQVVYLGVSDEANGDEQPPGIGRRRFLLYVGDYRAAYKNFEFLLRCLGQEGFGSLPTSDLVIATRFDPTAEDHARYAALLPPSRMHFCVGATDAQVRWLYSCCDAFLYPSLYEGFGLPVLEALQVGAPVVCSNAASLPEIGGDAVYYFNPNSAPEFATALQRALSDGRREDLVRMRQEHASQFSWEKTAAQISDIVREVAGGDRRG